MKTVSAIIMGVFLSMAGGGNPIPALASEGPLVVSFFERAPYYYTLEGRASGLLIDLAREIFDRAGVSAVFVQMPPKRILLEIEKGERPQASVGWFKTKERQAFASFSLPIYQDKPVQVVFARYDGPRIARHGSLSALFQDKGLVLARVSAFSYGEYIDAQISGLKPQSHEVVSDQNLLPRLIMARRADYMLAAPEEISHLVRSSGFQEEQFSSVAMPDIPYGNIRYLIFSRAVGQDLVQSVNLAIKALVPQDQFR